MARHSVIEIELSQELSLPQAMEVSALISDALDAYIEVRTPALEYVNEHENGKQLTDHAVTEKCNAVRWRNELAMVIKRGMTLTQIKE